MLGGLIIFSYSLNRVCERESQGKGWSGSGGSYWSATEKGGAPPPHHVALHTCYSALTAAPLWQISSFVVGHW